MFIQDFRNDFLPLYGRFYKQDNGATSYRVGELYDLSGRVVETRNCASLRETINLSALAAGTYILRLVEGGHASAGVKIVKQ